MDSSHERVVGVGARCSLESLQEEGTQACFGVSEFVDLSGGERVTLHSGELGFTTRLSGGGAGSSLGRFLRRESLVERVLLTVGPDEDDDGDDTHVWSWLAARASTKGVAVTAEELRSLEYVVEFDTSVDVLLRD